MIIRMWQHDYNSSRPHKVLGYLSPHQYNKAWLHGDQKLHECTGSLSTSASGGYKKPKAKTIVDKVFEKRNDRFKQTTLLFKYYELKGSLQTYFTMFK